MKPVYIYSLVIIKVEKLREIGKQEQKHEKKQEQKEIQIDNCFRNIEDAKKYIRSLLHSPCLEFTENMIDSIGECLSIKIQEKTYCIVKRLLF